MSARRHGGAGLRRQVRGGGAAPVAAAPWSPLDLPDIVAWYSSLDVDVVSGRVTTAYDSTFSGNDAAQGSAPNRPSLLADGGDGEPCFDFKATNPDWLARGTSGSTLTRTDQFTWAGWLRSSSTNTGDSNMWCQWDGGSDLRMVLRPEGGVNMRAYWASGTFPTSTLDWTARRDVWTHLALVFDGAGADNAARARMYVNGVLQAPTYGGTIPATLSSYGGLVLGAPPTLASASNSWAGRMDDLVLVARAITASETAQLAAYRPRSG